MLVHESFLHSLLYVQAHDSVRPQHITSEPGRSERRFDVDLHSPIQAVSRKAVDPGNCPSMPSNPPTMDLCRRYCLGLTGWASSVTTCPRTR